MPERLSDAQRAARAARTGGRPEVTSATARNAYLDYDPRNQTVYRHRPRENAQVNRYWMCDEGMLDYSRAHENRLVDARLGIRGTPCLYARPLLRSSDDHLIASAGSRPRAGGSEKGDSPARVTRETDVTIA